MKPLIHLPAWAGMLPLLSVILLTKTGIASADSLPLFSAVSSQCADPSGFDSCWANVTSAAQSCYGAVNRCAGSGSCTDEATCSSTNADCTRNCVCDAYAGWINCALSSCWNKVSRGRPSLARRTVDSRCGPGMHRSLDTSPTRSKRQVFSCQYQALAAYAALHCPGAGLGPKNTGDADNYIPYIPAPANAPGGCSCDISYVYYRYVASALRATSCAARDANGTSLNPSASTEACACCGVSAQVSTFYNTCPSTDPAAVPLWSETVGVAETRLGTTACRAALVGLDCRTLGFERPGIAGGAFYQAGTLPSPGTQGLENTGNAVITSPLGGPTLVWQLGDKFPTMTAVAAAAVTSSGSGGSGGSTNGSASNAAASLVLGQPGGAAGWIMAWLAIAVTLGAVMA